MFSSECDGLAFVRMADDDYVVARRIGLAASEEGVLSVGDVAVRCRER